MQAAAKPSKPAEKDDTASKDRNGDDNNGPSRGSQPAAPAGGATPGTATASGSAQGNRGGSAGPSNAASAGDRRQSTDRRRPAGKLSVWHCLSLASSGIPHCGPIPVCLSRRDGTFPDFIMRSACIHPCAHHECPQYYWDPVHVRRDLTSLQPPPMIMQVLEGTLETLVEMIQGRGQDAQGQGRQGP